MLKSCLLIRPKLLSLRKAQVTVIVKKLHQNNKVPLNIHDLSENKKRAERQQKLVLRLQDLLNCTSDEADNLIEQSKTLQSKASVGKMSENIEILISAKISPTTIKNNFPLLTNSIDELKVKLEIIESMDHDQLDDLAPLMSISVQHLERIRKILVKDKSSEGNRIYYFSRRLNVEPNLVAQYFSNHTFIFLISFKKLQENLNLMIEHGLYSINILNDLWSFIRSSKTTKYRLELCQKAGKENLKPWVITCADDQLETSLAITEERRSVLGDGTVIDYLSQRLGYDVEMTTAIVTRYKQVLTVRVAKLKNVLDYLLIEEKFEPYEVASAIRILCMSLETTKKRIKELKELGCRPTSLIYVCTSKADYKKFVEKWDNKSSLI